MNSEIHAFGVDDFFLLPLGDASESSLVDAVSFIVNEVAPSLASLLDRRNFDSIRIESGATPNTRKVVLVRSTADLEEASFVRFIVQRSKERVLINLLDRRKMHPSEAYTGLERRRIV